MLTARYSDVFGTEYNSKLLSFDGEFKEIINRLTYDFQMKFKPVF